MSDFSNFTKTPFYTPIESFKGLPLPQKELPEFLEIEEVFSRLTRIEEQIQVLEQPDTILEKAIENQKKELAAILAEATGLEAQCKDAQHLYDLAAEVSKKLNEAKDELTRNQRKKAAELESKRKAQKIVEAELDAAEERYNNAVTLHFGRKLVQEISAAEPLMQELNDRIKAIGNLHLTLQQRKSLNSGALPVHLLREPLEYLNRTLIHCSAWADGGEGS